MADVVKPAKHGRDHCPGGEDPIPCLGGNEWAYIHRTVDATLTSGSGLNLFFDPANWAQYGTSDEDVIMIADGSVDPAFSGLFLPLQPGVYVAQVGALFTQSFTGRRARVEWAVGTLSFMPQLADYDSSVTGSAITVTSSRVVENVNGFPLVSPGDQYVASNIMQSSGASRTVTQATFHICRVAVMPTQTV